MHWNIKTHTHTYSKRSKTETRITRRRRRRKATPHSMAATTTTAAAVVAMERAGWNNVRKARVNKYASYRLKILIIQDF